MIVEGYLKSSLPIAKSFGGQRYLWIAIGNSYRKHVKGLCQENTFDAPFSSKEFARK
jgi:hypothetical protein